MSYRAIFPKRNTLLLVVHSMGTGQVLRNVGIAQNEGADGVFLINHESPARTLYRWYEEARSKYPDFWVGLNCLDLDPETAIRLAPHDVGGIWVDNAGVNENEKDGGRGYARRLAELRRVRRFSGIYFGGVAFKYQPSVNDSACMAELAAPYVDVVTTSGIGTGKAPGLEKIRAMKEAIDDHPLAIASGITPENVVQYLEYTDCFLVATGVSDSHTELNPARVRQLVHAISS